MHRNSLLACFLGILLTISVLPGRADDDAAAQASTESRLRDALRNTMQQLQDAQGQVATLQATQAQSDKDNADLKAKVDALNAQIASLTRQSSDDKAASDKAIADLKQAHRDLTTEMVDTLSIQINLLNKSGTDDKATLEKSIADMKSKNPDLDKALSQYETDIQLWKTGYYQYVQYGAQTEAARAKLATDIIMLRRVVDDRETKNLELFNTANEILTRYEKFSLGDALSAKEPFVGLTRAKLQEFVQDYKDKILDEKIRIGQAPDMIAQGSAPAGSTSNSVAKSAGPNKPAAAGH
jgi:chromosome segregation ATPase